MFLKSLTIFPILSILVCVNSRLTTNVIKEVADKNTEIFVENAELNKDRIDLMHGTLYEREIGHFRKFDNLYMRGFCNEKDPMIYATNSYIYNDGKSQLYASIQVILDGKVRITCIEIEDNNDHEGPYEPPRLADGGINKSTVRIAVKPEYGRGFLYTVRLYGKRYNAGKPGSVHVSKIYGANQI